MPENTYGRSFTGSLNPPALSASLATTDGAAHLILSIPMDDESFWVLDCELIGQDATGVIMHYRFALRCTRTGAGAPAVTLSAYGTPDLTGGSPTVGGSGANITISVTAGAVRHMNWAIAVYSILKVAKAV